MNFWSKALGAPEPYPQQRAQPQGSQVPWWAPEPPHPQQYAPQPQEMPMSVNQLRHMDASTLSQEALEQIARARLQEAKYNDHCPHCDSTNFGRQTQSSAPRCFDCGYSTRDVHGATGLQPVGRINGGRGRSFHARDVVGGNWNGGAQHVSSMSYRSDGRDG